MKASVFHQILVLGLALFLPACTAGGGNGESGNTEDPFMVFLVRHAEKTDHSRDPDLSRAGYQRAKRLALTLADAKIEYVHSTDFLRTRKTAAVLADQYGLETELYDPRDLFSLADQLKAAGGRHLVVGHSNTTPNLVEILGGDPGSAIQEENEYDRLYILTISEDQVQTLLLRYGNPFSSLPSSISASSLEVPQTSGSAWN